MYELNIGTAGIIFVVFGACTAFTVAWIMRSEKVRKVYEDEMSRFKRNLQTQTREISMLSDQLEVSEVATQRLKEDFQQVGPEEKVVNRISDLEERNALLNKELVEARSSLEEVFKAVYEE